MVDFPDQGTKCAVLAQPASRPIAEKVMEALDDAGGETGLYLMPDGEEAKTLGAVGDVYQWLVDFGLSRDGFVVGVGGGSLTDASGFVAATWMRGVTSIYVPTTLLGAVDAAIGGKTGVNVSGKNLVGVFRLPLRVVVDLDVLDALSDDLKRQGAAEVLKAGLLADRRIVDGYIDHGIEAPIEALVPAAIAIKAEIVAEDFTETGRRSLLNLGHTIGHAVEFASGLSHGEAVAVGLVAAAAVSERKLDFADGHLVTQALESIGLPVSAPALDGEEVRGLVGLDKKRTRAGLSMALLQAIGSPVMTKVDSDDIEVGLAAVGL